MTTENPYGLWIPISFQTMQTEYTEQQESNKIMNIGTCRLIPFSLQREIANLCHIERLFQIQL